MNASIRKIDRHGFAGAPRISAGAGFTLVELLVVIGLVSVVGAVMALGLNRVEEPISGQAAQSIAMSLVSTARAQATRTHAEVMLLVEMEGAPETNYSFLRSFRVAVRTDTGWRLEGDPVRLPRGVYVVPPADLTPSGVTLPDAWSEALRSSVLTPPDPEAPPGYGRLARFSEAGELMSAAGSLVLASARRETAGLRFTHPGACRGLTLSAYGIATAVNTASGFPE